MALANCSDLTTSIGTWRERAGDAVVVGNAADCVALAEAAMTRELPVREMWVNTPLSGTLDSRELTLPSDYVESTWLKRTDDSRFRKLTKASAAEMIYAASTGIPTEWCINAGKIDLNCPAASGLTFSLRYRKRYALATTTTNWLLTNHPDIYLAGVLKWSGLLLKDDDVAIWNGLWEQGKASLHYIESDAEGDVEAQVDNALLMTSGRGRASIADLMS